LGTQPPQPARNFMTSRASGGFKVAYPFAASSATVLTPHVGIYGDYYYSRDASAATALAAVLAAGVGTIPLIPLQQGWSAHASGGVTAAFDGGAQTGAA